ncbi:MAG: ATP-binding protein, partial [Acidobacteriota bacterium]
SLQDQRSYLGAVVEGPFAEPDGLRADATPIVVTTVQGAPLMPKYHGRAQVEIMGEELANGAVVPPRFRPNPKSPVEVLDSDETRRVLKIEGDLRLGLADGFEDLVVSIPSQSKNVLPRHLGILGTTGGGKSTTVSSLLKKAQERQICVILIDTEGEYCTIHEPTGDDRMREVLRQRKLEPQGVDGVYLHHLVGREASNPEHPRLSTFSLRFSDLSPYAVQEILDLTQAQAERFFKAYDVAKLALDKFKIWPTNDAERRHLLELDEFETGYPGMTLTHLYDVVKQIGSVIDKDAEEPFLETRCFLDRRRELKQIIGGSNPPKNVISWRALQGKLGRIKRLKIFDSPEAPPLDYRRLLSPGRVSILDLGDTDSTYVNNLVIAELLRGVQHGQEERYRTAVREGRQPTPVLIFIEEAHEFLSAQKIKKMEVLFQQVSRIARRGRKRWLGLVFITQLPQHLPDEVLGLINNWILHKISDSNVISRLKRSIGGINDTLWRHLPSLAPGQAIVSLTSLARPLEVSIDPTPCKLLMVE